MTSNFRCAVFASFAVLAGCAGNGEGLDSNGRPLTGDSSSGGGLQPTLKSIQDNVFTPICSQCHLGAAAPLGLRLDEGSAFAMLVNAPASEVPSLNRVTPGDPDSSYIIQKLEGRAAVGGRMPLGQPALPQATIDVIKQWIRNGAAQAVAPAQIDVTPMQVHAVDPAAGENLDSTREILLQAAGTLNLATLNNASVSLVRSGRDGTFSDGNEVNLGAVHVEARSLDPTVLAVKIDSEALVPDSYRLTLSGSGAQAVRDTSGLAIGEFVLQFTVGASL
jgi:hypothetical protein